jgi:hypothetical protein
MQLFKRWSRLLRLALLPLLVSVGAAVFLLMRPRTESMPPAETATAAADTTMPSAAAPAAVAVEAPPVEATPSAMAQALAAWRDPFQAEAAALTAMQEKIKLKEKEIESLKLALEEKKLRDLLRGGTDSLRTTAGSTSTSASSQPARIELKALLCGERRRAALLVAGDRRAWVGEGESFADTYVSRLEADAATLIGPDGRSTRLRLLR